jgi:RNA polymerase sigma factor (sigma-70 family)
MPKSHSTRKLRDCVTAAQGGDKEAFSELVFRFQDMAYGIAYAMLGASGLAQDAAQEAFIAAYLNLATLREPAAFPGWFRRIVIKYSDRERRSLKPSYPLQDSLELPAALPDPIRILEESENTSEIHRAIAELPAIQKQIVTLFYLRDYSQKEIEEFLELPVSTIKKHSGIKAIDLFAPLVRGGQNGILTPHSNVGALVLLTELVLRMDALYGSRTLCLGLDDEIFKSRDLQLLIRDAGISDVVSVIFGNVNDSAHERSAMLNLAIAKAKDLRAEGKEVLFLVMNRIDLYEDLLAQLKAIPGKDAGITTLYFGAETAGAESAALANLDAVIGFDFARAKRGLYPAVDPLYSHSRLLQEQKVNEKHQAIAAEGHS